MLAQHLGASRGENDPIYGPALVAGHHDLAPSIRTTANGSEKASA